MKKLTTIFVLVVAYLVAANAQKYITKEGEIEIFSKTSLFTIEAKNQSVASILDASNGDVVASTLVRSFKFKEALVEEHFNENYMESHEYPKSAFKGKITNWNSVDLNKDGTYNVTIEGELTMHGQTNPVKSQGTITVAGGKITGKTEFEISLEKFKIEVEENYKDRINDKIKLVIHFDYSKMG